MTNIPDQTVVTRLPFGRQKRSVPSTSAVVSKKRTRDFAQQGIAALDAAHLAAAEIGGADVVLTCDDVMVRRGARLGLSLRVLNPMAYLEEVAGND